VHPGSTGRAAWRAATPQDLGPDCYHIRHASHGSSDLRHCRTDLKIVNQPIQGLHFETGSMDIIICRFWPLHALYCFLILQPERAER
jgi:hypothetical protein